MPAKRLSGHIVSLADDDTIGKPNRRSERHERGTGQKWQYERIRIPTRRTSNLEKQPEESRCVENAESGRRFERVGCRGFSEGVDRKRRRREQAIVLVCSDSHARQSRQRLCKMNHGSNGPSGGWRSEVDNKYLGRQLGRVAASASSSHSVGPPHAATE